MLGITLTIAIVASVLVVILRPHYAVAVYFTVLCWYPNYLVVNIGNMDISAVRIVVSVLLLRCLCSKQIKSAFVWSRLDTLVILSIAVYVVIFFVTRPLSIALENRSGFLLDTWFAYMAVRFCITTREGFSTVVKCVGILLAPLAILGVVEAVSGWQPYLPLTQYCPWRQGILTIEPRTGFNRAVGPFGHPIMFGACFAMFLPLIYSLRHQKNAWHSLAYILSGVALLGGLSSMSSGPWAMVIMAVLCLALEKRKHWVKPLLIFFVISCIGTGIISNRPFYHVILSRLNPIGGSWWHRARLIDLAIENIGEWWLAGYGEQDPGWGQFLGSDTTDLTNQYILHAVQYGTLGVVALCVVLASVFSNLNRLHNVAQHPQTESLAWALGSSIFAVTVVFMSVSFFGQMLSLFYCLLGMVGSTCNFAPMEQGRSRSSFLCK